jgi:hypothetical protein
MKELEFQTLVRKAVEREGGFGLKMSNRFLVGVPDLLVHLPGAPTMVLEAKFSKVASTVRPYRLELSPRQSLTLRQMAGAGMVAGVVSLIRTDKLYGFRAMHIREFEGEASIRLPGLTYCWCNRAALPEAIVSGLRSLAEGIACVPRSLPAPELSVPLRAGGRPSGRPSVQ